MAGFNVLGIAAKALTKVAPKAAKEIAKSFGKQASRNAPATTKSVASRIASAPSVRRVQPVQVPITRATTPTRVSFTQAVTQPRMVPSTRVPAATPTMRPAITPPPSRLAIEPAPRLSPSREVELYRPAGELAVRTPASSFTQAAGVAPEAAAPALAGAAADVVQEVAKRTAPRFLRPTLEVAGSSAPYLLAAVEDQDTKVPGFLKGAANIAAVLAGGSMAARGLGRKGLLNQATRDALKGATKRQTVKNYIVPSFVKGVIPASAAATILPSIGNIFTGAQAPVELPASALPSEEEQTTVLPPLGGTPETPGFGTTAEQDVQAAIDAAIANISSGTGTADDAATVATGQKSALDQGVADAMAALEAAYGGPAAADAALAAGDPILLQQLAGIEADYQAGLGQIQANYAGALAQVQGYQTQADQLLQETAAAQMAGFGAAAGGLEAMSPGTGMTGAQAAAAGVSDTALGGAGITGAALSRGLAGAASVQAAADRLRLGTDLSGQLATGRLTQADLEAGLARAAVGEKAVARTESAKRESAARELAKQQKREDAVRIAELKYQAALDKQTEATRKAENEASRKDRLAELKMNAEINLAMKIAGMTPAERAAYKGSTAGSKNFIAPSWYGQLDTRDPNLGIDVKGAVGKVTVSQKQRFNDLMDAQLAKPESTDPSTAQATWAVFFNDVSQDPNAIAIYTDSKRPTSAAAMYKLLFGSSTPKK